MLALRIAVFRGHAVSPGNWSMRGATVARESEPTAGRSNGAEQQRGIAIHLDGAARPSLHAAKVHLGSMTSSSSPSRVMMGAPPVASR